VEGAAIALDMEETCGVLKRFSGLQSEREDITQVELHWIRMHMKDTTTEQILNLREGQKPFVKESRFILPNLLHTVRNSSLCDIREYGTLANKLYLSGPVEKAHLPAAVS
jgi:hypothetical protein